MATNAGLPLLPVWYDMSYTNDDGSLTTDAIFYNDQMNQTLRKIINSGLVMPSATTAELTLCRDDVTIPVGTVWFSTTLGKLAVKTVQAIVDPATPGVIEQITSTPYL